LTKDLLGKEFSDVLQSLMNIKLQVLNTKIASCSNKTYQDLIVRQANILNVRGLSKSSEILLKIADTLPTPPEPPAPTDNKGIPGVMATNPIPVSQMSDKDAVDADNKGGMAGFMEGMEGGVVAVMSVSDGLEEANADTIKDVEEIEQKSFDIDVGDSEKNSEELNENEYMGGFYEESYDFEEESDGEFADNLYVNDDVIFTDGNDDTDESGYSYEDYEPSLFVKAQGATQASNLMAPPANTTPSAPLTDAAPVKTNNEQKDSTAPEEISVSEEVDESVENFDSYIDKAFENLSVTDIVNKLNDLTKIFKTREIPRQLSTIDMMLDHLGLSTYFPSLAEATNKSLESNQYILSRIEDIASRLQGSLESKEIDLSQATKSPSTDPETIKVKNYLEKKNEKEKERKLLKKEIEEKALEDSVDAKEKAEIEVQEDMAGPVNTTTDMPQATPAKPAVATAPSPVVKPA
jgi:hypothetical protein